MRCCMTGTAAASGAILRIQENLTRFGVRVHDLEVEVGDDKAHTGVLTGSRPDFFVFSLQVGDGSGVHVHSDDRLKAVIFYHSVARSVCVCDAASW